MSNKLNARHWDDPLRHPDHARPVTRRDFVSQGFLSGSAFAVGGGVMSLFANPRDAFAQLSDDLTPLLANPCDIATSGAGKIPFIAFDLAGGANIAGRHGHRVLRVDVDDVEDAVGAADGRGHVANVQVGVRQDQAQAVGVRHQDGPGETGGIEQRQRQPAGVLDDVDEARLGGVGQPSSAQLLEEDPVGGDLA